MNRSKIHIPFNVPYYTGKEKKYIENAFAGKYIAGNGLYTKKVHRFFEEKKGFNKVLMTTSGTDALEMTALLLNIKEGDEVIVPSYTFVSTALAYARQGATIKFVDSMADHPNMDVDKIEPLISKKTKAIVVVHYAGIAVNMDKIMSLAKEYNLFVIEDAAQAIDSYYKGQALGTIGDLGIYSFHETKNIHCGEGGLLIINNPDFEERAEIIWEKGTNRSQFFKGEVNKYEWVDTGSSFLPDEMNAAFLLAQLEDLDTIQAKRLEIWNKYFASLKDWAEINHVLLPHIPEYATNNAHMFYMIMDSEAKRDKMLKYLKQNGIHAVFHYMALHNSPFYRKKYPFISLRNAENYTTNLLRLPLFTTLSEEQLVHIINSFNNISL